MRISTTAMITLAAASACAAHQPQKPLPYDYDLFHKDIEVESVHTEFLYWTVQEGALDYAQKMRTPAPSAISPSYAIGRVKSASFDIDPGIRIGVSYYNAPKYWEVRGQYTHLISSGKDRASAPSAPLYLTGTWPQILSEPLVHAHSAIRFNYNLFDALIARLFNTNPHLRLRLMAGLSAAWIQQYWNVHYFDSTAQNTTIANHWKYIGGGIRLGMTGDWYWGNNVYLTGLTTISAYMGSYENRAKQTISTQLFPVRNSNFCDARPAFMAQFELGPSWQQNFGKHRIELLVAYELNAWMNLQETRRSSGGAPSEAKQTWLSNGMIALHGLTSRFTVDF